MPPAITKKRHQLEPISYDELLSNAGMSGFVSFLEAGSGVAPQPQANAATPPAPTRSASFQWAGNGHGRQSRIRQALQPEDGHSLAEQAVYEALWKAATPVNEPLAPAEDRTIRIGYHRLAQLTRLSWVSVKANLRSLEKKLAIEVIGSENSAMQEGKHYRVYAGLTILERRHQAGLVWVRRTRGVELLTEASFLSTGPPGHDTAVNHAFPAAPELVLRRR